MAQLRVPGAAAGSRGASDPHGNAAVGAVLTAQLHNCQGKKKRDEYNGAFIELVRLIPSIAVSLTGCVVLTRRVLFGGLGCCCPLLLQGAMEAEAVSSGRCSALLPHAAQQVMLLTFKWHLAV